MRPGRRRRVPARAASRRNRPASSSAPSRIRPFLYFLLVQPTKNLIQPMRAMEFDQPEEQAAPTPEARPRSRRRLRSPEETRARRRRILAYGLFIFSLILMVNALVGENGYLATLRARRERDALMQTLNKLQQENHRLMEEANRLKNDPAALEEAARRDLGLMRPGETLVVIHDRQPDRPATGTIPPAPNANPR